MSEYQYYEFLAMDRQLTSEEMSALRSISSRAHITPVSLNNVYNFGDFKGNPTDLVRRYFEAHVYMANWGTAVFMINLPLEALSRETAETIQAKDFLDFKAFEKHWVIIWSLDEPLDLERFSMDDGTSWMKRLAPIREELLRGDLRSLYIGWLAAVSKEMIEDEKFEPLSLEGLGSLTPAQQALAEFLEVDPDILAGAGMGSPALEDPELKKKMMDEWLNTLSQEEIRSVLRLLLAGQGRQAERKLKDQYYSWLRSSPNVDSGKELRTVKEIRKNADSAQKVRLEKEWQEQKRQEEERRQKRQAHLEELAQNSSKAWEAIQRTVGRGSGLAYKEACQALVDLSEAYSNYRGPETFQQELNQFMGDHMRRKAFIKRLIQAGLLDQDLRAKKPTGKKEKT
jgi:hypothetical protein